MLPKLRLLPVLALFSFLQLMHAPASAQDETFNFGLRGGINYPTLGGSVPKYAGLSGYGIGMFITLHSNEGINMGHPSRNRQYELMSDALVQRFTLMLEPTFTNVGFHETENDNKYNNYYFDFGGILYFQPIRFSNELQLYAGIKPSYLITHTSEVFVNGEYQTINYGPNLNKNGRIDFGISAGVAIALSEAVTLEVGYTQSTSDRNSATTILGRPNTVDLTLRVNALGLRNQLIRKEAGIMDRLNAYSKGSLLVMLTTPNAKELARLVAEGKPGEAEMVKASLRERNIRIMNEFRQNFNFCKLYFFMDQDANKVVTGNPQGIFVNSSMQVDTAIRLDSGAYFVASITDDISAYTTRHQFGLFVYDSQINQLGKPFNTPANLIGSNLEGDPFNYFRRRRVSHMNTSFVRVIEKFNSRLLRYRE